MKTTPARSSRPAAANGRQRSPYVGLAVLSLPTLLVAMDMTILHLAVPAISADLRPSGAQLLWISDIYAFVIAGALIPLGALGDRIGRRRILLVGAAFFGLASILAAFSTSAEMLIAARALLGLAGASLLPSTLALIRGLFPDPQERSLAIGLWTTCFTLGGVIGPLLGGALIEHFWWGSVFLAGVPVMVVLLILGPLYLPEHRDPNGQPVDTASALGLLLSILCLTYALKFTAEQGVGSIPAASALVGFIAGLWFLRRQTRIETPLLDLTLFRNAAFVGALSANTMALFAGIGTSLLVAQYLQLVAGLSPLTAGFWSLPPALASVIGCLGAPVLARRRPATALVAAALAVITLSLATLAVAPGFTAVIAGSTGLGLGVAATVTLGTDLILSHAPEAKAGGASALSETGTELGGAFGVAILGSIGIAFYRGALALPPDLAPELAIAAQDTLASALAAATLAPEMTGIAISQTAKEAFVVALRAAAGGGAVILLATTVFYAVAVWLRPAAKSRPPAQQT